MSLTVEQVMKEVNIDRPNAESFIKFCIGFDCLDCETYAEAKEKIMISMLDISNELEQAQYQDEQREIFNRRYQNFPFDRS